MIYEWHMMISSGSSIEEEENKQISLKKEKKTVEESTYTSIEGRWWVPCVADKQIERYLSIHVSDDEVVETRQKTSI